MWCGSPGLIRGVGSHFRAGCPLAHGPAGAGEVRAFGRDGIRLVGFGWLACHRCRRSPDLILSSDSPGLSSGLSGCVSFCLAHERSVLGPDLSVSE